ncbi:hypothetical protein Dsin_022361 [Dipteronia sinensis]|uniref:RING-type E3 ubiquitin transferase n=1 Tax=Dipteronia sinensis TaxID=43782 RepID=A0AAE0A2P8_9ROSI|nr:hypothetical protein Dsin_022361 [Dipteronia sinensis]
MAMVMGSSSAITSSLVWFIVFVLFLLTIHCTATEISYHDPCSSIVLESPITAPEFASLPFPPFQNGYYDGGDRILNSNPSYYSIDNDKFLSFETQHVFRTDHESVFKVEASLILHFKNRNNLVQNMTYDGSFYSRRRSRKSSTSFSLKGFWSEYTGELCMVGTSSSYSPEGKLLHLTAVLKLSGVKNSTITSLIRGTLKSLSSAADPNYFEPISILMFPQTNYQYNTNSNEFEKECSGDSNVVESSSLSLHLGRSICSVLAYPVNTFQLEYASDCNSSKTCNPFGDDVDFLPQIMSLNTIQCSSDRQSLRFLMEFPNSNYVGFYHSFNPNTTFVGEGTWDSKKNRLCVVACRFMKRNASLSNSQVGDCSIRMNLRFSAIWSIRNMIFISGQIWSNKSVNDIGYFKRIAYRSISTNTNMLGVLGLKYEYTETDKVRMSCSLKKPVKKSGENYPDGYSTEMSFDTSVRDSGGAFAWGYWSPISVGDQIFQWSSGSFMPLSSSMPESSSLEANTSNSRPLNISYKISFSPLYAERRAALFNISSSEYNRQVEIFAEGIYDAETGSLCMVGCRYLGLNNQTLKNDSMDCEIRVNLQFPSLNAKKDGVYITGNISSARKKSDPLHFESVSVSSAAFYTGIERQSIWRMDMEILMVLITNTLACIFVVFQLLYVKRHPGVLPFISLLMLVVLTLGHMMLLLLNFEALFLRSQNRQTVLLGSGGWLEVHEVIVRIVTMVAFVLQFRLLQLSWSSRIAAHNNQKASWIAEKKAWYVSLPLYLAGALISVFVNLGRKNKVVEIAMQSSRLVDIQFSLWGGLRSYAGLILDGFLFPQILLNIFQNSTEKVLSPLFYIGYTLIRLVPHAYDLYRAHNYVPDFDGSYIYADHKADFYSTAWDVSIPLGCILFAAILYFQQRFGGRCFLPRRSRELEVYEKVPAVDVEE